MTSPSAPFPPLVPGGEGLQHPPAEPVALRRRMAEVYGVPEACVLPIRGVAHGLELVLRRLRLDGQNSAAAFKPWSTLERLAEIYGVVLNADLTNVAFIQASIDGFDYMLADLPRPFTVLDESSVEFGEAPSVASLAAARDTLVVLRDLSLPYGLAGAPFGALIATPERIRQFEAVVEPNAWPTPLVRLAELALSPSRVAATEARIALVKSERFRMETALETSPAVEFSVPGFGPDVFVKVSHPEQARASLARWGVDYVWLEDQGGLVIGVRADDAANDRALAALGAAPDAKPHRRAEVIRDTKETRIAVAIDLDAAGPKRVHTGIGFYDHMLDQVATHGGFSLVLACEGDLEIDPHHTIEDCALAFGGALKQALGDRRGIGRFGFVLPMDETEAKVSIDLGGRPYCVFEGDFAQDHIGAWPTQMTSHVFRSLAESLGAAIHVSVTGENDHHKVEACFKAFGRALRQAIRVEGDAVPSTKGVL